MARVRSNRMFYAPGGNRQGPFKGRGPRHGAKLSLKDLTTHPVPAYTCENHLDRYGHVHVQAFERMHPKLDTRGGIAGEPGCPVVLEGTVIGINIEHQAGGRTPKRMWSWVSNPIPENVSEVAHWWSMYLRRFDPEHTFRFLNQQLGWAKPKLHDPFAADPGPGWWWLRT